VLCIHIASTDRLSVCAHASKITSHRLIISATTIGAVPITLLRDKTEVMSV